LLEARHLVSLNTCNGCHAAETATDFFHVGFRKAGQEAPLSKFLTGTGAIDDPAGQEDEARPGNVKRRCFHDLADRLDDLRSLLELGAPYETKRLPRATRVH